MGTQFKIKQLIFSEYGFFFEVENIRDKEIYHCKPSRLFSDEKLLQKFSPKDIFLIGYYAANEEREAEHLFFRKQKIQSSSETCSIPV